MKNIKRKMIINWCLYDSACAAFSIIVVTFIFSTYFTQRVAHDPVVGTSQWANATSLAGLIVAISSPICGAIADRAGHRLRWLAGFTLLCVLSTALFWFVKPESSAMPLALACLIFGTIGYELAQVFYNAFLPELAPAGYVGRISGWGWGSGYIGGIIVLSIALIVFVKCNIFHLDVTKAEQIRACGLFAASWILVFSLPFFITAPPEARKNETCRRAILEGCVELRRMLRELYREKNILKFLIARMIYTDGLNTLFAFGGIYAAGTYGFSFTEVLIFGITMNIAAGIGAISMAWLDDRIGSKKTILFSLASMTMLAIPILLAHERILFWVFALCLSLFVGPVQSASRSLLVRCMPNTNKATELFGLYALSGRVTAFVGPWLLGLMTEAFQSQRAGVASILCFFVLGGLLLLRTRELH